MQMPDAQEPTDSQSATAWSEEKKEEICVSIRDSMKQAIFEPVKLSVQNVLQLVKPEEEGKEPAIEEIVEE